MKDAAGGQPLEQHFTRHSEMVANAVMAIAVHSQVQQHAKCASLGTQGDHGTCETEAEVPELEPQLIRLHWCQGQALPCQFSLLIFLLDVVD